MFKNGFEKTQEEILQERAEVLGRAGERLFSVLKELKEIEKVIDVKAAYIRSGKSVTKKAVREINGEIDRFNRTREYAKLRYYYLIVIREAVGFRRHKQVEEIYRIPPPKRRMSEQRL